jgi:hypothetical protein
MFGGAQAILGCGRRLRHESPAESMHALAFRESTGHEDDA